MESRQVQFKVDKPVLSRRIEENCTGIGLIEDEDCFRDICISGCSIENQAAGHVCFEKVVFRNVEFRDVALNSLELTDVRFENCDLSNANFSEAIIHRTEFVNCKLVGLNLSGATMHNVCMEQCNGRFGLLSYTSIKKAVITDCTFENGSFQNSRFDKVIFRKCNLRLCRMSGTSLAGMDLSDSDVEGLCIQPEDLRGAIVSPVQAVDFSRLLGLVIRE